MDWSGVCLLRLQSYQGLTSSRSWASSGPNALAGLEQHSSRRLGCSKTCSSC